MKNREEEKNEKTPFCLKILEKSRDIQGKRRELVILKDLGKKSFRFKVF
jgi:hypothetical protein